MVMNIVLFFRILYADFRKTKREGGSSGGVTKSSPGIGGRPDKIDSAFRRLVRGTEEEEVFSEKTD